MLYVVYRRTEGKPVLKRVTVPETALTREPARPSTARSSCRCSATPLDDDIMQTAGRLAAEENDDEGEGGAVIEALWIFEVPMSLPLDARVPDEELKRARAALEAREGGGGGVRGRRGRHRGRARPRRPARRSCDEARRRGVEAIVLAAEEPTRMRGGLLLGGKRGLHDTFVGETTRYVVNKAPCRVILTAPPGGATAPVQSTPTGPVPTSR